MLAGQATLVDRSDLQASLNVDADAATDGTGAPYAGDLCLSAVDPALIAQLLPPAISPCQVLTVQAVEAAFIPGASLTVANYDALAAGTLVDLWHLPGGASDWQIIGEGQVTAGGSQVVTNAPGLPGGGYVFLAPKAPSITLSADNDNGYYIPTAVKDGNVQLAYSLPSYSSMGQNRSVTLVYNSAAGAPNPLVAADVTLTPSNGLPPLLSSSLSVGGVQVAGPVFTSTTQAHDPSDPGLTGGDQTVRQVLTFDAAAIATGSYPYRFTSSLQYACSKVGATVEDQLIVSNESASAFGAGWTIAGLQHLNIQDDQIVLTDGSGAALRFEALMPVIPDLTGAMTWLDPTPASVVGGALESNGEIRVIPEQVNLLLPSDVTVDTLKQRFYSSGSQLSPVTLRAGLVVNSYLLHGDRLGATNANVAGTITFDSDIVGVIVTQGRLDATDGILGRADMTYPVGGDRGLDFSFTDRITIHSDLRRITLSLRLSTSIDQVRVITLGPSETVVESTFDSGIDGWTVTGDVQTPIHHATGGNPDGNISAKDNVSGIVWYWHAPASIYGNRSDSYDGLMRFDLMQSSTSRQFNADDIRLVGNALTLEYNTTYNPQTSWTSYLVQLNERSGWRRTSDNLPPSEAEFRAVLADLQDLRIRGEFRSGADTGRIDNFRIVRLQAEGLVANAYLSPPGDFSVLSQNPDGSYLRRMKNGDEYHFDADGNMTLARFANGQETAYAYDAAGNVTSITDPAGLVTQFVYNAEGLLASTTDPAGRVTSYVYDSDGNLLTILNPDATSQIFAYTAGHRLSGSTDPNGQTTAYNYDQNGLFDNVLQPDGATVTASVYRELGLPTGTAVGTEANPLPYARPGGLEATIFDGNGNPLQVKLDSFGNVVESTDALGRTTTYERDADGLVIRITWMQSNWTGLWSWNGADRAISITPTPSVRCAGSPMPPVASSIHTTMTPMAISKRRPKAWRTRSPSSAVSKTRKADYTTTGRVITVRPPAASCRKTRSVSPPAI